MALGSWRNIAPVSEHLDALRANVANTPTPAPELAAYLEKVRAHAYKVTDADVDRLKAVGLSEDEIFEQTVAAAISEGLRRLDAAAAVIG
jgi:alkylhydroperoxidase family enzyme